MLKEVRNEDVFSNSSHEAGLKPPEQQEKIAASLAAIRNDIANIPIPEDGEITEAVKDIIDRTLNVVDNVDRLTHTA